MQRFWVKNILKFEPFLHFIIISGDNQKLSFRLLISIVSFKEHHWLYANIKPAYVSISKRDFILLIHRIFFGSFNKFINFFHFYPICMQAIYNIT